MKTIRVYSVFDDFFDLIDGISQDYTPYAEPYDDDPYAYDRWTAAERKAFVKDLKELKKLLPRMEYYMRKEGKV